jgi:hypothetical protein
VAEAAAWRQWGGNQDGFGLCRGCGGDGRATACAHAVVCHLRWMAGQAWEMEGPWMSRRFDTSTIKNQQSAIINQRIFQIIGMLLGAGLICA